MTIAERSEQIYRDTILALLSDEENARVSTAEAAREMAAGSEYLDLNHLELGLQRVAAVTVVDMGHVLPRDAVSGDTWGRILNHLKS
ncbi:MAG: hypothetical protein ABL893_08920 [Hyphomicrobium sp.]|nr:hypothetical protein [Hyphomicrobium sp.]